MGDINDLIAGIEVELEACEKRQAKTLKEREFILAKVQQDGRSNLTDEEQDRNEELRQLHDGLKDDEKGIRAKLANANEIRADEDARVKADRETKPTAAAERSKQSYDRTVRVTSEERTYRQDVDPRGSQFLGDIARNFMFQDVEAQHRLSRHMQEERVERGQYLTRAAGTGAFAGLTVPQYLTDLYAPATAGLRPFADICNSHQLPDAGMSVNISRITTATSAALQASENSAVSETNIDDTLLTLNVQTAAGQQTLSRQAIERGSGAEEVTVQDLFNRVATNLDSTLINQAATGLTNVSQSNAYTDATPTGPELYPKILGAASGVEGALLAMGRPSHAVMHPRRWYWLSKEMSSTWPMVNFTNIPTQASAVGYPGSSYNSGVRGVLPCGLEVVTDANIGTTLGAGTEDEIYVVAASECHLWEDGEAPMFIRAEQPAAATLGVLLVAYKYFAYTFARYTNGSQKIAGTGLIAPAF
jgi:hypothetical protein